MSTGTVLALRAAAAAAAAAAQHRRKSAFVCLAAFLPNQLPFCPAVSSNGECRCGLVPDPYIGPGGKAGTEEGRLSRAVQPALGTVAYQQLNLLLLQLHSLLPSRCRGLRPAGVHCLPLGLLLLARSGEEMWPLSSPLHCCLPQSCLRPCSSL